MKITRNNDEQQAMLTMLRLLHSGADVRADRVQRIKDMLVAGTYENRLKLQVATERAIEDAVGSADGPV